MEEGLIWFLQKLETDTSTPEIVNWITIIIIIIFAWSYDEEAVLECLGLARA